MGWLECHRITPACLVPRVLGLENNTNNIPNPEILADAVVFTPVVSDCWCVHALLLSNCLPADARKLLLAVPDMADETPVDQVFGRIDGKTGEGDES